MFKEFDVLSGGLEASSGALAIFFSDRLTKRIISLV
jgi:hypothetical protein